MSSVSPFAIRARRIALGPRGGRDHRRGAREALNKMWAANDPWLGSSSGESIPEAPTGSRHYSRFESRVKPEAATAKPVNEFKSEMSTRHVGAGYREHEDVREGATGPTGSTTAR